MFSIAKYVLEGDFQLFYKQKINIVNESSPVSK